MHFCQRVHAERFFVQPLPLRRVNVECIWGSDRSGVCIRKPEYVSNELFAACVILYFRNYVHSHHPPCDVCT